MSSKAGLAHNLSSIRRTDVVSPAVEMLHRSVESQFESMNRAMLTGSLR